MSFRDGHDYDLTTPAYNFSRTDDRLRVVVATLDDHIRPKRFHEIERRVFVKKNDEVNAFETRNKVRAIALSAHGATRSFEAFHGCVGIDADNQGVTSRASGSEKIEVTWMQ